IVVRRELQLKAVLQDSRQPARHASIPTERSSIMIRLVRIAIAGRVRCHLSVKPVLDFRGPPASRYGTQRLVRARIITREWTHVVLRQSMRKAKWPTLMQAVPNGTAFRQRRMPFMTAMPIRQQSTPEQRRSPETKATCRI